MWTTPASAGVVCFLGQKMPICMDGILETTRTCSLCGVEYPLTNFPKGGRCKTGYDYRCLPCSRARNKAYRDSPAGRRKRTDSRYKRVFGITLDDAETMLENQGGVCAICRKEMDWTTFVVDHCHDTGRVRGILCNNCNTGIGMMQDDVEIVKKAVEYLDIDWGSEADEPIVPSCNLENPEICESCT